MALYRLYKPEWEASLRHVMETYRQKTGMEPLPSKRKRKRGDTADGDEEGENDERTKQKQFSGGGRKGISSGLSVVVKRFGKKVEDQPKRRGPAPAPAASSSGGNWWEEAAG